MLAVPVHGCLNIHGSQLPRWRGAAPIHRAIEAGDATTAVGIMRMEAIKLTKAEERAISVDMLMRSSEVFLTNALGVRPITHVDGKAIGDGEPGLITQLLATRL